jgi:hypothetical protein
MIEALRVEGNQLGKPFGDLSGSGENIASV